MYFEVSKANIPPPMLSQYGYNLAMPELDIGYVWKPYELWSKLLLGSRVVALY